MPVVRTFGERGGVRKRASLMGEGCCKSACLGRTFRGRRPPGFRASARSRMPKPGLLARAVGLAAQARPPLVGNVPKLLLFPVCVHLVQARLNACPQPAGACIVLPRAAPQSMRPREPREPDTAEDAGGQTDHLGQACKRWLVEGHVLSQAPVFHEFLESIIFFKL